MRSSVSIVVFAAALFSTLDVQAQVTWIVDAANGPGTSFTNLPPAVAAAASGDTIIVRAGTYAGFQSMGKALTIRGAGASTTTVGSAPGFINPETAISAVPAGLTFFVDGLKFAPLVGSGGFPPPPVPSAALVVTGPGTVVVADVTILASGTPYGGVAGLAVSNGAEVHVSRSTISGSNGFPTGPGGNGVLVTGSNLAVDASTINGGTSGSGVIISGGSGLVVSSGVATLSRSSAYGATGAYGGSYGVYSAGSVRIAGTAADVIQGAPALFAVPFQGVSIGTGVNGSVVVHGNVSVPPPGPLSPATSGSVTLGAPALPYLSMTGTATPAGELLAAQPVTATFDGVIPFAPFVCGAELVPGFSTAFSWLLEGELLLPVPTTIVLEGTLDAAGMVQVTLTPAVAAPALVNVPVYVQFAVLDAVAGKFRMSNGAVRIFTN